jgi:hypothetical protein
MKRHVAIGAVLTTALVAFVVVVLLLGGTSQQADGASATSGTTPGTASPGTPVPFGTPDKPLVGDQDNTNPVLDTVQNWRQLVQAVEGKQDWYKQCLQDRTPSHVTWDQARQFADLVDQGHDLRFMLVSNSSVSDDQARQMLKDRGIVNVDNLPIKRVNGFQNTQGLPADRCQAFGDSRSQVRLALAVPNDPNDLNKGIREDEGVLGMCANPFNLLIESPPPTTPSGGPSTPGESLPPNNSTVPPEETTTTKPPTSWDCQQNGGAGCPPVVPPQPVQNNPCCYVGPTPGAPPQPVTPPVGPPPQPNTPAPAPTSTGSNSGSPTGSGTPGGSTCNGNVCQGGGPSPPSSPPTTVDTGTHTGDPGGF